VESTLPTTLNHARMRAALANLDEGEFTEGHELDRKWKVAKAMVGRRLSQEEAKKLLAKFRMRPMASAYQVQPTKGEVSSLRSITSLARVSRIMGYVARSKG